MTDKGYDSKANRDACRARGIVPVIPYRSNAKNRPKFFPKLLYKTRARVEQAMGKLKAVQEGRHAVRENQDELRSIRQLCLHVDLGEILPQDLALLASSTGILGFTL